jgi:hypothetical protein
MTEEQIYKKLLERLTGNNVAIAKCDKFWTVNDTEGFLGVDLDLENAVNEYFSAFCTDVIAYVTEEDDNLDNYAKELKQKYSKLLT